MRRDHPIDEIIWGICADGELVNVDHSIRVVVPRDGRLIA